MYKSQIIQESRSGTLKVHFRDTTDIQLFALMQTIYSIESFGHIATLTSESQSGIVL